MFLPLGLLLIVTDSTVDSLFVPPLESLEPLVFDVVGHLPFEPAIEIPVLVPMGVNSPVMVPFDDLLGEATVGHRVPAKFPGTASCSSR